MPYLHKLTCYARLMRWDKPIGIYLCLWPALWALWLASDGRPAWPLLLIIILGSVVVRSAGCVINDIWDRDLDHRVERTRHRPITSGQVSAKEALVLFGLLTLLALGLVSLLNPLSWIIALFAGLMTALYPLAKRVTHLPQVVLGFTFNTGILIAYAATQNHLPPSAWLLYVTAICWTVAYDTMYALADKADDLKVGIKSTAILFSQYDKLIIGILQIAIIISLTILGLRLALFPAFAFGLFIATGLFVYQHYLIRHRHSAACLKAFLNNHFVGLAIFLALFVHFC